MSRNFSEDMQRRMREATELIRRELPRTVGTLAVNHFRDNFRRGGFVNGGLKKWPDVKRRDPESPWYGFEYKGEKRTHYAFKRDRKTGKTHKSDNQKRLNYSASATTRGPMTSKRNNLMGSLRYTSAGRFIRIASDAPYAKVHNEGGDIKVFGRGKATLPARRFIGDSVELNDKVEAEITKQFDRIFKRD